MKDSNNFCLVFSEYKSKQTLIDLGFTYLSETEYRQKVNKR